MQQYSSKIFQIFLIFIGQKSPPASATVDVEEDEIRDRKKSKSPPVALSGKRSAALVIIQIESSAENCGGNSKKPEKNATISAEVADPQTCAYEKTLETLRKRTTTVEKSDVFNKTGDEHEGNQ